MAEQIVNEACGISALTPLEALPEYVTVDEFGTVFRLGRTKAYEMARTDHRLKALRFGRTVRIPRAALLAMAKEGA